MSVKRRFRRESKAEFVTNGYNIEKVALDFTARLTTKKSRMYSDAVIRLATIQSDLAYVANEIFPTNKLEFVVRKLLLTLSRGTLCALENRLGGVYEALMENPQEAFERKNGAKVPKGEAEKKIDKTADALGVMIDSQYKMIKAVKDSDREKMKAIAPNAEEETVQVEKALSNVFNIIIENILL